MVECSVMEENTLEDVDVCSHYIHWAMCELSWNKEIFTSLTIPINVSRMNECLKSLNVRFMKIEEDKFGNSVCTLKKGGVPNTYLSALHSWINEGTTETNFSWQTRENYDFTPILEEHIRMILEPKDSEIFSK